MDLHKPLALEELAQRLVTREFTGWRALSDILSGARARSSRHIRNEDRRATAKEAAWRKQLKERYALDDQLLPQVEPGQEALGLFREKLLAATDLRTRWKLVEEEARHLARAEVGGVVRARLKRACDRRGRTVLAAVSAALRANGTRVSGIEVGSTVGAAAPLERGEIAPEHLVHAQVDILAGSLTEGGRQWRQVTVQLGEMSTTGGAQSAPASRTGLAATNQEIAAWMVAQQNELKEKDEKHGRDVLVRPAMQHFGVKQKVVRQAWDGRPGAPKRK